MGSDQSKEDENAKKRGTSHGATMQSAKPHTGSYARVSSDAQTPPLKRTTSPTRNGGLVQREEHVDDQHQQYVSDLQNAPSALDSPAMAQSPCEYSEHDEDSTLLIWHGGRRIPPVPLTPNDLNIICSNFQHPPIGQGGFSTVFEGIFRDVPVAVKMLAIRNPSEHALFQAELAVLLNENIRHPNLLPLVAYCQERPALVMPRLKPLNRERLPRLPGSVRMRVSIDVARGLAHLHAAGFVHNDMKPDNVLLEFDAQRHIRRALVGDLGCAKLTSIPVQPFGTMLFMDPALNPSGPPVHPKPADDVYSFGLTLVCIFTNTFPEHQQDLLRMWATIDSTFPLVSTLARQMTHPDARMRPTCAMVAETLVRVDSGWREAIEQQQHQQLVAPAPTMTMMMPAPQGGSSGGGMHVQPPPQQQQHPPIQQQYHQPQVYQQQQMVVGHQQQQQPYVGQHQQQLIHQQQHQGNYAGTPPPQGVTGSMQQMQFGGGGGQQPTFPPQHPQQCHQPLQQQQAAGYIPSSQRQLPPPQQQMPPQQQHQYYQAAPPPGVHPQHLQPQQQQPQQQQPAAGGYIPPPSTGPPQQQPVQPQWQTPVGGPRNVNAARAV